MAVAVSLLPPLLSALECLPRSVYERERARAREGERGGRKRGVGRDGERVGREREGKREEERNMSDKKHDYRRYFRRRREPCILGPYD